MGKYTAKCVSFEVRGKKFNDKVAWMAVLAVNLTGSVNIDRDV
jgi:hypothetical protein